MQSTGQGPPGHADGEAYAGSDDVEELSSPSVEQRIGGEKCRLQRRELRVGNGDGALHRRDGDGQRLPVEITDGDGQRHQRYEEPGWGGSLQARPFRFTQRTRSTAGATAPDAAIAPSASSLHPRE